MTGGSLSVKWAAAGITYSCSREFYSEGQSETARRKSSTYNASWLETSRAVNWGASVARGRVRLCVDLKWQPNKCTGYAASGHDTY